MTPRTCPPDSTAKASAWHNSTLSAISLRGKFDSSARSAIQVGRGAIHTRPGKPTHLRSETPPGVVQEVYALSLGHYVTRALMAQAAALAKLDPDWLSFVGCLRILKCRLPECDSRTPQSWSAWYEALLWEMSQERLDGHQRRNRVNPRVVKRKMSKFKKKRPDHRKPPRLNKTFAETIVMRR